MIVSHCAGVGLKPASRHAIDETMNGMAAGFVNKHRHGLKALSMIRDPMAAIAAAIW
jgi:hypothetical protein